jgi:hypothetical protein
MVTLRKLVERRSNKRRWVYLGCAVVALLFGILAAGMEDDFLGLIPYIALVAVCVIQFMRPTLFGWSVLIGAFVVYTVAVLFSSRQPPHEFLVFLSVGGLPALALLWSWPKPLETAERTEPGMTAA